jgi:hypothetical protein
VEKNKEVPEFDVSGSSDWCLGRLKKAIAYVASL